MARAKRTDRAEARRRYRASIVDPLSEGDFAPGEADDEASPATSAKPSPPRPASGQTGSAAPARPSISGAFRASFRPLDLRGDIRALPGLMRHRSFLLPLILSSLSVALIPLVGLTPLTLTFWQYFAGSGPLGAAFIVGFFAPRASWLLGGLVAAIVAGLELIAFQGQFGGLFDNYAANSPTGITADEIRSIVSGQVVAFGIPSAALFAAAAAWYKRFLNRANPNRGAGRPSSGGSRRPDGKVPKKSQQRPMLARRR